ncbi:RNA-binding protein [Helicobacter sp. MIT 21-1697]|uniref:RNA recognition motif domain-containing protein n=1 Tax=Helicobacter sp. MIT 21-1697 TaxID=2993733 RepID=UPI00224B6D17|nr:RNA-binding protein [Helicobacter sp. MIT 21-1697]MCX2717371.1 RNA-binding protein [Helicobacter sp. MIT 21-1697]
MKTLYVGNLVYAVTHDELKELFSQFGEVFSVKLINDRESGKPKGFGFVEIADEAASKAIDALNEKDFRGRNLRVNEARPRESF